MCHLYIFIRCANEPQQIISTDIAYGDNGNAGNKSPKQSVSHAPMNALCFISSKGNRKRSRNAITKEQRHAPAYNCNRENNSRCTVGHIADHVSDKNLIYNVVKTRNDKRADTGNRKLPKQLSHFLIAQIITVFHYILLGSYAVFWESLSEKSFLKTTKNKKIEA